MGEREVEKETKSKSGRRERKRGKRDERQKDRRGDRGSLGNSPHQHLFIHGANLYSGKGDTYISNFEVSIQSFDYTAAEHEEKRFLYMFQSKYFHIPLQERKSQHINE